MIVMIKIEYIHVHQLHAPSTTGQLPRKLSDGKRLYRLQKSIEEALGQCRTLAFLNNDIPTLETALDQCKVVTETLASSSTTMGPNMPPVFHSIAKAGVEEFKSTSKALHRVGVKRKHKDGNKLHAKKSRTKAKPYM